MSLTELITGVEDHQKTLTICNAGPTAAEDLRERFADRNVHVRPSRPRADDRASITVSEVTGRLGRRPPRAPPRTSNRGSNATRTRRFSTTSTRRCLPPTTGSRCSTPPAKSRTARGASARANSTRASSHSRRFRANSSSRTTGETDVDVHAYGVPDVAARVQSLSLHGTANEIADSWFVVFDGGGDPTRMRPVGRRARPRVCSAAGLRRVDGRLDHRLAGETWLSRRGSAAGVHEASVGHDRLCAYHHVCDMTDTLVSWSVALSTIWLDD